MSQSATFRRFKRRIGLIKRRVTAGPSLQARQVSAEVMEILGELRRASDDEPEIAIELSLSLLETLPQLFMSLDDRFGLLSGALEHVPALLTDLINDDIDNPLAVVDRFEVFERIFCLWVGDDSGYLQSLDETLLACATTREDEDLLGRICKEHLRHVPIVFPAPKGQKLDLERSILQADRHRVERLLGEIYVRRGRHEFAVIVARAYYRATGDAVDFVKFLFRSGLEDEAIDVARRVLKNPASPRHAQVKKIFESILERREAKQHRLAEAEAQFVEEPSHESFAALKAEVPEDEWEERRVSALGGLESRADCVDIVFELYLEEGMILEADGLVVTKPIDPQLLAERADGILEEHTDQAAGWLLIAAYHLMKTARAPQYKTAAAWLLTVQRASEVTGQTDAFHQAMAAFKERYRRRTALLRILGEHGL